MMIYNRTYQRRPSSMVRYRHGGYSAIYPLAAGEVFSGVEQIQRNEQTRYSEQIPYGGQVRHREDTRLGMKTPASEALCGLMSETIQRGGVEHSSEALVAGDVWKEEVVPNRSYPGTGNESNILAFPITSVRRSNPKTGGRSGKRSLIPPKK